MAVKISIVIPTYQRPALLKKCLDAIMLQSFPKEAYEVIIVTDGPDEETHKMVQQYTAGEGNSNVSCYSLIVKKGPAAARNVGWKIAKGELILFTDDDCIPDFNWAKNYYNAFTFYEETLIAFTGKILVPRSMHPTDFELNTAHLETADFVTANCACSKAALEMVDGFDEAFTMAWREDSDLEFKLLKRQIPIIKTEEAEVCHPVRKAPWGVSLKEQKKSMFDALLFKKHPLLYKERIRSSVLWDYFFMIVLLIVFFIAWLYENKIIALVCLSCWIFLVGSFTMKRLHKASHSFTHIVEMVATSILIPFFSMFWNLYGAYKFKALHL
jgi:glycosyltransferase involved in cell wall biosynthesis